MNLVDSPVGEVWSTNVEAHGESFDDDGSNLQDLSVGPDRKSEGVFEASLDVEVRAFSGRSYTGDVVGLKVILG